MHLILNKTYAKNRAVGNSPLRRREVRDEVQLKHHIIFFCAIFFLLLSQILSAQPPVSSGNDSLRVIQIVEGKSLRQKFISNETILETIAGNVVIKEGLTTFYCDSATINRSANVIEAFGNIHINDNDSIHTYAQYLRYVGNDRIAYLQKNVKLTDKKGILTTDNLQYDFKRGEATYTNGGKITNEKTVLTSIEGIYYANVKDVYFKKNVHLTDPERNIWADSLLYNIQTNIATFISPTHIVGKDGSVIDTKSGIYNLKTGEAVFYERTAFRDSTHFGIADKVAYDKQSNTVQMEGNAKLVDSANKVTVIGNQIFINSKVNSFLATNKPVMILHRDDDSTYVAADTLFSGLKKYDSIERQQMVETDTLKKTVAVKATTDTSFRYFLAFHHVRIFNDSLQAVSDSLHYSAADSTFKLFKDPVVWNGKSQVTGDTIYLYTEKQKAKRLYVFNNAMVINKVNNSMYNQIAGRILNGFFKNGNIDYITTKGSPAESIYYPRDDDSAYIGMNRCSGDVIDFYFLNKELDKVKFINDANGVLYPMNQIPADKKELSNFKWLDKRRPKNKLELFE